MREETRTQIIFPFWKELSSGGRDSRSISTSEEFGVRSDCQPARAQELALKQHYHAPCCSLGVAGRGG